MSQVIFSDKKYIQMKKKILFFVKDNHNYWEGDKKQNDMCLFFLRI